MTFNKLALYCLFLSFCTQYLYAQKSNTETPQIIIQKEQAQKPNPKPKSQKGYMGIFVDQKEDQVYIVEVVKNGPAFKSGLKKGDVFYEIDGGKITNLNKLYYYLSQYEVNDKIDVKVLRDSKITQTVISLGSKDEVYESKLEEKKKMEEDMPGEKDENIQMLDERTLEERGKLGVSLFQTDKLKGLLISEIYKDSPADKAGLQEEDLILECNGKQISNRDDLSMVLMDKVPGDTINLIILRNDSKKSFTIRLD